MVRAYISVALGGIVRQSDPLARTYGWIPSRNRQGSVTLVPYIKELYREEYRDKSR